MLLGTDRFGRSAPSRSQRRYVSHTTTSSFTFSPPPTRSASTPTVSVKATSGNQAAVSPVIPVTDDINHIFSTIFKGHERAGRERYPIIVRNVTEHHWKLFIKKYGNHPAFRNSKFEYDDSRSKIIAIPPASPLHDIPVKVMSQQVYMGMPMAGFATHSRVESLLVDRENFLKRGSTGGLNQREPDCALWCPSYNEGIVPTIIWEVGHSQKRSSLIRRAKMWCRRYDGKIRVVILVKYLRKDPRVDNASELMVYRPQRREDGKWTAVQDGRNHVLFPRPPGAVEGVLDNPDDAVPLTYEDYFGTVHDGIEAGARFDLSLERVRRIISVVVLATIQRERYRFVSGGSSVGADAMLVDADAILVDADAAMLANNAEVGGLVAVEDDGSGHDSPVQVGEYEQFGQEWDAAMSDVSDNP